MGIYNSEEMVTGTAWAMNTKDLINNIGNKRGRFSNKCHRIAKLIDEWDSLESKFVDMVERGQGQTQTARLAYGMLVMLETGIRVGNESSAEGFVCDNQKIAQKNNPAKGIKKGDVVYQHPDHGKLVKTYGLTTLLNSHVKGRRGSLNISFVGKKIVAQSLTVKHSTLLQYRPQGNPNDLWLGIRYPDLKKFVKRYVGRQYTPKDLRMAKVNKIFLSIFNQKVIKEFLNTTTKSGRKKILAAAIEETANIIGHTRSVCKSAYLSQPLINYILTTGDNQ